MFEPDPAIRAANERFSIPVSVFDGKRLTLGYADDYGAVLVVAIASELEGIITFRRVVGKRLAEKWIYPDDPDSLNWFQKWELGSRIHAMDPDHLRAMVDIWPDTMGYWARIWGSGDAHGEDAPA